MDRLRSTRLLARLVLAWFVAVVGVAAAAPAWNPQALDMVCTGAGMKLVAADPGEGEPASPLGLDCPLCMAVLPPPPAIEAPRVRPQGPEAFVAPSVRVALAACPALPARGPPSSFA